MAQIEFVDYSFKYPRENKKALDNINLNIEEGEFLLICGPSGSGKSTLIQQLKTEIAPEGETHGKILYNNQDIMTLDGFTQASDIGMVFQEPEAQIVTDRVINELAFSMENLGYSLDIMGRRMGEIVQFFGMGDRLYEDIHNLSGGQKQVLNLASVLLLQPKILLLDEPTSQLDPIASRDFVQMLESLNKDYSITVLLTEHRLDEVFPIVDRVIFLEEGHIKYKGSPEEVAREIYDKEDKMFFDFLPDISKLYFKLDKSENSMPLTVREGKAWIKDFDIGGKVLNVSSNKGKEPIIKAKNISFKYERERPLVLDKLNLGINKGEILSILGGNGSGKSTLLRVLSGAYKPQYGKIYLNGENYYKISEEERYKYIGYLDQNPILYFLHDTVEEEIYNRAEKVQASEEDVQYLIELFDLKGLLNRHPYDISGGEKQKLALALVLLAKPEILLLDEATKGIDPISKVEIGKLLLDLKSKGMTIIMATHDIEFAARFSDRCALLFDGDIKTLEEPREFFSENYFYTTTINRIVRNKMPQIILYEDVVKNEYI
ncbi:MAG: ATP-binding cassette domain-containing protein [Tissierellia bacterium]|nr:ATP-binding cassette domain-containing protein [Tissierellia bacterium]